MKKTLLIESTLTVELNAHDIIGYMSKSKMIPEDWLIPEDWQYYSVEVKGKGISEGATFIIKKSESKPYCT